MKRIPHLSSPKSTVSKDRIIRNFLTDEIASKFSGEILDDFAKFLTERNKDGAIMGELTKSAGKLNVGAIMSDMNPDVIPISVYEKMKLDYQVSIGLSIIKLPILAQNWSVRCADEKIRLFVKQTLRPVWRRLMKNTLTSVDYGYVVCEKVWENEKVKLTTGEDEDMKVLFDRDSLIYKKIKAIYPGDVRIVTDKHNTYMGFEQSGSIGGDDVFVPSEKSFLFTNEEEFSNFYGRSRLKGAYTPWYMKQIVMQFLMKYLERRGIPPIIVTAPPGHIRKQDGTLIDNLTSGLNLGKSMLSNTVGVKPYTESKNGNPQWAIEYLKDDQRGSQFLEVLNWLDVGILRGILVPERAITQDSGTGTFSMSQTHADFFLLAEEGLITDIEEAYNEQIVQPLVNVNFVGRNPCFIQIDTLQFGKKEMIKNLLVRLLDKADTFLQETGSYPFDAMPDLEKLAEIVEVPLKKIKLKTLDQLGLKPAKIKKNNLIKDSNVAAKDGKDGEDNKGSDDVGNRVDNNSVSGNKKSDTKQELAELKSRLNDMEKKYKRLLNEVRVKNESFSLQD